MDDLSKTLEYLQNKTVNCSKSERLLALDFLKSLIVNLEQIDNKQEVTSTSVAHDCESTSLINEYNSDKGSKTPLKLTIRKFNKNDSIFTCDECSKRFISMQKMLSHVLQNHSKAEVTCMICKGTFFSFSLLKYHECFMEKQNIFIRRLCGLCGKLCIQIQEYQSHMKVEHMIALDERCKYFGCSHCDSTFKLRGQLIVHISKKHKDLVNKEQIAQKIRFKLLKKTISTQNNEYERNSFLSNFPKRSCSPCKRNFLSERALERHLLSYMHRLRAGELNLVKKFICDICQCSFIKLNCLQRHMTSHQEDLPHKCILCDYRTAEKCNLSEHMRRHYQIRNYVCEFCDAKFIAKRELKDHVAFKHNTLRPYECSECGKMFKTKRILTRHTKTHSNFRPYVCACGSNFLRMTNLRRHIVGIHHDANPTITKVQVPIDKSDEDTSSTKPVWYGDSKFIKNKKVTSFSLMEVDPTEKVVKRKPVDTKKTNNVPKEISQEEASQPKGTNSKKQKLSINYMIKSNDEEDKDPKLYSNMNQDFLYQSDNSDKYLRSSNSPIDIPVTNGIISNKSSLQDSNAIDESMNICDLVVSPSYPLLETADPPDDTQNSNKAPFGITLKTENLSNYKVESIMMDSDNRNSLDGIWRPIDTVDQDQNIIDEQTSSLVSNAIDMFPQNSGLISSFNEVFLSSVSNNCYSEDAVQWNNMSLGNSGHFNGDNSNFIITGSMSACDSLSDNLPISDAQANGDNFIFYNNHAQQQVDNNPHQSFAYIESYSSSAINLDHNYGSISDNIAHISFCTGVNNSSFQHSLNTSQMQDLFPISYSSTSHSDFISNSSNNTSLSNMLFSQEQLFSTNTTLSNNSINLANSAQPSWLQSQHSPISEFSSENVPTSLLESYKLSSSSSVVVNSMTNPTRILSPIDFLVADSVFPSGEKHEFCLSFHDLPVTNDINSGINDNPLISDFCSQSHQYQHTTGQLCSKNFSVVNLISTGCASHNSAKENDDIELLYS